MADILNLPGWTVIPPVEQNEHDYKVTAQPAEPALVICPNCSNFTGNRKFGTYDQIVMDLPAHGRRVGIHTKRQRYQCKKCNKTFSLDLPGVSKNHSATQRLVEYIGREARDRTFVGVARETGYSYQTVINLFAEHVAELDKNIKFETPEVLGLDELWLMKRPCAVLANVTERTIFDLLPDRNKATVKNRLLRMDDYKSVRYVAIDMWQGYRDAVRETLPQACIVIDKFHVVRYANSAFDSARKRVGKELPDRQRRRLTGTRRLFEKREKDLAPEQRAKVDALVKSYPLLGVAHRLKEDFYAVYDAVTADDARRLYREWQERIPAELREDFRELQRAVKNWEPYIFNYFGTGGITNAFTECLNGLIKLTNRLGRGYSFDVIRAKAIHTRRLHKTRKPRYQRDGWTEFTSLERIEHEPHILNFGADISTLTRLLEEESF